MLGIRTTALRIDAPIAIGSKLLVSEEYLHLLVELGNQNLALNKKRTQQFQEAIQQKFVVQNP
jgi:tRNA(Phe) wybutosine-synthesizing methylase Tyw3